jgi:hypothetical protein
MTRTEDRIRDALGALADLVPAAGAPRTSPEATGTSTHSVPGAGRHGRLRRLYLPAAAAMGTVVVIMLAFVLGPFGSGTRSGSDSPGASPVGTPASPKPDPARAGRFFAVLESDEYDEKFVPKTVTIRAAANGKATASVAVPKGVSQWYSLSGTAVPGLFYLAGYTESKSFGHSTIYRLTVDDRGRLRALTPVGIDGSLPYIIRDLAASPDGTRIAFPVILLTNDFRLRGLRIDIADVTSGKRMTFQSGGLGRVVDISWDAAGRYLGFVGGNAAPTSDALWVLDTSAPGDLFARSKKVSNFGLDAPSPYTGVVLGADAQRFYLVSAERNPPVIEVDVRTGGHRQIVRIRESWPPARSMLLLARSPAGTDLLLMAGGSKCHRISLATFTATPFPCYDVRPAAVAW